MHARQGCACVLCVRGYTSEAQRGDDAYRSRLMAHAAGVPCCLSQSVRGLAFDHAAVKAGTLPPFICNVHRDDIVDEDQVDTILYEVVSHHKPALDSDGGA